LARAAQVGRPDAGAEVAAPRVDVQAAAPRVAGVHGQLLRRALAQDVGEDALDALFVELVVLAEADQVAQQAFLVDLRAAVMDLHAGPVGLAGHQAVRFKQVGQQLLFDRRLVGPGLEQAGIGAVFIDLDVEAVQQHAFQLAHFSCPKSSGSVSVMCTVAPKPADKSCCSSALSASALSRRVWLNEFRYSLNDFDSTMLGESAGTVMRAIATCGLPRWFSHEIS